MAGVLARNWPTDEREIGVGCADFVPNKVGVVCDRVEAVVAAMPDQRQSECNTCRADCAELTYP